LLPLTVHENNRIFINIKNRWLFSRYNKPISPNPFPHMVNTRYFRYNIEKKANEKNYIDGLYQELVRTDHHAVSKVDCRNVRRVIPALEVHTKARNHFSEFGRKQPPAFDSLIIGLTADRPFLYRMVDHRVDEMMAQECTGKVENLIKMGYDFTLPAMSGIGYRRIGQFIKGNSSRKRQYSNKDRHSPLHPAISMHGSAWMTVISTGLILKNRIALR
jgi:hypothetical protein